MEHKTLLVYDVFNSVFSNNRPALEFLVSSTLAAHAPLTITFPLTISSVRKFDSGFIRSDGFPDKSITVYAEDSSGAQYDIDLMVADEKHFAKQARIHSSNLMVNGRYTKNKAVEEYIILFTPNTLPNCDSPLSIIEWKVDESGQIMDGTDHILIVNCENDTMNYSNFHDMIHDLRQSNPDEIFNRELRIALLDVIANQ